MMNDSYEPHYDFSSPEDGDDEIPSELDTEDDDEHEFDDAIKELNPESDFVVGNSPNEENEDDE